MPAPADPFYVFHRIKGELMRLMYLENMRATTEQLINGFTKIEARYAEAHKQHITEAQQALVKGKTKPAKLTKQEEHSMSVGWANYMRGYPREESEHEPFMLRGWDAAQTKHPVQPHTGLTKEEQQPDERDDEQASA